MLQRLTYEAPLVAALGPLWSALSAGYAVVICGVVYLTPAGERYLEQLETDQ
jgi:hypothetical protein